MPSYQLLAVALLTWALGTSAQVAAGESSPNARGSLSEGATKRKKSPISYRKVRPDHAYHSNPKGPFLGIKITPPTMAGPENPILVEIYNLSKANLALVKFDINLINNAGYDLASSIQGDDMLPGQSAIRHIKVTGKGHFPPILRVEVSDLRILDTNATDIILPTYVDLVVR